MSTHSFPALSRRQWLQCSAAGAVAAASPLLVRQSQAATLPANFLSAGKPVTLVVGGPAGGATDGVARVVAQELSKSLAHEIVVENKAGASGTIGSKFVSQAKNDGHTLLLGQIAPNVLAPLMQNPRPLRPGQRLYADWPDWQHRLGAGRACGRPQDLEGSRCAVEAQGQPELRLHRSGLWRTSAGAFAGQ